MLCQPQSHIMCINYEKVNLLLQEQESLNEFHTPISSSPSHFLLCTNLLSSRTAEIKEKIIMILNYTILRYTVLR
jgi:hypothetical protein